jgi:RNA exonuclease 1
MGQLLSRYIHKIVDAMREKRKASDISGDDSSANNGLSAALAAARQSDLPPLPSKPENRDASKNSRAEGPDEKAEEGGEWQTVKRKKPNKRERDIPRKGNYPELVLATPVRIHNKIKIGDLQGLALYVLADGNAPQWIAVRHKQFFKKTVVLMVPGLESGMFDGSISLEPLSSNESDLLNAKCICTSPLEKGLTIQCERCKTLQHANCYYPGLENELPSTHVCVECNPRDIQGAIEALVKLRQGGELKGLPEKKDIKKSTSPDDYFPRELHEIELPDPLKPMSKMFTHLWPVMTPGDDRNNRMHSPVTSMLSSPIPKSKSDKKNPQEEKGWVNRPTPVTKFIASVQDLRDNDHVLHPASCVSEEEKAAEQYRRETNKTSTEHGWVDSAVSKLEDGDVPEKDIESGSMTQGRDIYALDCEMCKTTDGEFDLTRISVITWDGEVIMDELVLPEKAIIDYLTP